jgi:hypothetical protein
MQTDAIINPSLIGYGEFAVIIKAPYITPQQTMFLMDSKRGVMYPNKIWV